MSNSINITRRDRRRTLKSGAVITQTRYVLNYREPRTGKRRQLFFERQKDAQSKRNEIIAQIETGSYAEDRNKAVTVAEVTRRWLDSRQGEVKDGTLAGYGQSASHIIGPLLAGTPQQRWQFTTTGKKPEGTRLVPMLGNIKVRDLTTRDIRTWHKTLAAEVGWYSANRAKMFLNAVLALAAEDLNIRPPAMPANLGRGKPKIKKAILTPDQISLLIQAARADLETGIYVASRSSPARGQVSSSDCCGRTSISAPTSSMFGGCRSATAHHQPDQDGCRDTRHPDVQPASQHAAGVARFLSTLVRRTPSRVSRAWLPPSVAAASHRRWRSPPLLELPREVLGAGAPEARPADRHAPLRPALLHLDAASPGDRGGAGGEARKPSTRFDFLDPRRDLADSSRRKRARRIEPAGFR
jgi:hypothetical protein